MTSSDDLRDRVRPLLRAATLRFCRVPDVLAALDSGPDWHHAAALRALVMAPDLPMTQSEDGACVGDGEQRLFAAIALALAGDASGLPVLRGGAPDYATNSGIERGLADVARLLLGDLAPPLRIFNAAMMVELATVVGAWPPQR